MQEKFLLSKLLVISVTLLSATLATRMSVDTITTPTSPSPPSEILQQLVFYYKEIAEIKRPVSYFYLIYFFAFLKKKHGDKESLL